MAANISAEMVNAVSEVTTMVAVGRDIVPAETEDGMDDLGPYRIRH